MAQSLPSGDHLLVAVEYYSRYVEVDVKKSTTTDKIIASLKFLTNGLPKSISSDNGPQFISQEFKIFAREQDIFHEKLLHFCLKPTMKHQINMYKKK